MVPNTTGVRFHSMVTVSLNDQGGSDHINNTGAGVPISESNTAPSYLVNYPQSECGKVQLSTT
ncbi:MAG: hypothetical protein AVDCRST_MAG86-3188 [uncultured Truepera sp.]|uniref:Uncharacterized protein n=1 Tax=uncultured Truepera sp. TaxID=543023 RepID=A0A6J4VPY8_9DEIN|nr:MAG: hypothetical protein AVDCRST_MAG86-3188 [uncultured Truepera sp.]